jgi:hypothetical protein
MKVSPFHIDRKNRGGHDDFFLCRVHGQGNFHESCNLSYMNGDKWLILQLILGKKMEVY